MTAIDFQTLKDSVTTPAFVVDTAYIAGILNNLHQLRQQSGCKVLFSIKSLPLELVMKQAGAVVDGFSVSSLFEARFASEVRQQAMTLHMTTPGLRNDEILELGQLCQGISFNSLEQYQRLSGQLPASTSPGLRVNPGLSFTEDIRYDPCRQNSKLGVPLQELAEQWPKGIKGLHFHTVFGSQDFKSLLQTVALIEAKLGTYLAKLDWINLGGGYLYDDANAAAPLIDLVQRLCRQYDVQVYIEPGNALVGRAGYLVATVIDLFNRDGKAIAIVDTSINHHPEVFEYQKPPSVYQHDSQGSYSVILAGGTCLAGDLFGEYRFNQALKIDDKIIFTDVGAYSLIKANRFNGYNLPTIYSLNDNRVALVKRYHYQHYQQQWLSD